MSNELVAHQRKLLIKYLLLLLFASLSLSIAWLNLRIIIFEKTSRLMVPETPKVTDEQHIIYDVFFNFVQVTDALGYFIGGLLADRFRRNKALGYFSALFLIFALLAYIIPDIYGLTLARICLSMLFGGAFISIISLITEYTPMNRWTTIFGLFGVSMPVGYLILNYMNTVNIIYNEPSQIPNIFLAVLILSIFSLMACSPIIIHKDLANEGVKTHELSVLKIKCTRLAYAAIAVEFLLILSENLFLMVILFSEAFITLRPNLYLIIILFVDFAQIIGGLLADKYGKKLLMFASCISIPLMASIYLVNSFTQFILISFIMKLVLTISYPVYPALIVQATKPQKWASVHGLRFFYQYLVIWIRWYIFLGYMKALYKEVPKEYLFIAVAPLIVIVPIIMMIMRLIDDGKFKIKPK